MICPQCRELAGDKVIDSRVAANGKRIRRRRCCLKCGYRWSTLEILASLLRFPKKIRPTTNSRNRY